MDNDANTPKQPAEKKSGFATFLIKRVVVALVLIAVVMWALAVGVDYLEKPAPWKNRWVKGQPPSNAEKISSAETDTTNHPAASSIETPREHVEDGSYQKSDVVKREIDRKLALSPSQASLDQHALQEEKRRIKTLQESSTLKAKDDAHPAAAAPPDSKKQPAVHIATSDHPAKPEPHAAQPLPKGVTFVNAVIRPIEYELTERFWGWRPNDMINLTDNVNNFQLGVLEVTRRTTVQLAERISRTGSTDSFNKNLENAMNWVMVKADRYWFPSPEAKYKESLEELKLYRDELMLGEASFHTRTDNLIPLLAAFEDLLGSCDENLVKTQEGDGTEIGFFSADNYFYYAKGVATAMEGILEAIHHDFEKTLTSRHGEELLHHAIVSCHLAASLDPWIVTNGALDGILANHRAHMAAPISHARFYIGQLIKTLST